MTRPVRHQWDGEAMRPAGPHQARLADREYCIGEFYDLVPVEHRSRASHGHMFAWLNEAFNSLPEQYALESWAQSPEHLRKYALIRRGWYDVQTFACNSEAEAQRWAANLRPLDDYAIVTVKGSTVERYTAKSQSSRAMGKQDFEKSKRDILEFIAGLLGVDPDTLGKQEKAA